MRSNAKKKITILITLGMIFASFSLIVTICSANIYDMTLDNKNLKISAVSGIIHIENNWTATKAAGICTGNGTYSEPYVIEDLVIDGGGSESCILIENSDVYFKIENCTVYNSIEGIKLSNVNNSLIITNYCSSNYCGIFLSECNNNTILGNNATNNYNGIYLDNTHFGDISGNNAFNNGYKGIHLSSSDYNNVSGNNATNNHNGISLFSSDYNNVSGNAANSNRFKGICLFTSDYNNVSGNTANSNYEHGIRLMYSDFNFLLGNNVTNNNYGISLSGSGNNIIEGNFIINNDVGIYIYDILFYSNNFKSEQNEISNNTFIGNNQDILKVTYFVRYLYEPLISLMLTLLSIATSVVVISCLTVELIRKLGYPREDEKYQPTIYGISALVVESVGALLFILGAIFLIPIDSVFHWLLILIPFSVVGIIISRKGLKKDEKKFSAGLGMGFGIGLLILNFQLILTYSFIIIIVIAIVYIAVLFVRLCLD